jgi:plastocyanin
MLQRNRVCRRFTWLGTGLLLTGCLGCQGTEPPAVREAASGQQAASALPGNAVHEHAAKTALAVEHNEEAAVSGNRVSIDNFTFNPETLEIVTGTKVIWVNSDDVPHTVRSTEDVFRSGTLDTDDVFERVFSEPGTYEYYCGVHRHMAGKIVVKESVMK